MKNLLLTLGVVAVILVASTYDYTEQVVYNMPKAVYQVMKAKGWTDKKIATEYQRNREYWKKQGLQWELENGCCE